MSQRYSIVIKLDVPRDETSVQIMLARGLCLDMIYYKFMDYDGKSLNPKEAAFWCLEDNDDFNPHCLTTKIGGINTNLHFISTDGDVMVMLSGISHEKLKHFKYGSDDIDIGRYAKIMLDLVQDYKILEMRIEKI